MGWFLTDSFQEEWVCERAFQRLPSYSSTGTGGSSLYPFHKISVSFICAGAPLLQGSYAKGRVRFLCQAHLKGKSQNPVSAANAVSTICHASSILQRRFCRHMWGNKKEWIKAYSVNEQDSGSSNFSTQKLQEETFLMFFWSFLPTDHTHLGLAQ